MATIDDLPPKQREVVDLVLAGKTAPEIAKIRGVAEGTVRNQMQRAWARLGVRNKYELAAKFTYVDDTRIDLTGLEGADAAAASMAAQGWSIAAIASALGVKHSMAAKRLGRIMKRYGVDSRVQLIARLKAQPANDSDTGPEAA